MLTPDRSKTFGELLLDLAVDVGQATYEDAADNRAALPSDPATLDRLKRAYNNGAAEFARARRWTFLQPTISITLSPDGTGPDCIAGSTFRYRLPVNVQSAPIGRVGWSMSGTDGGIVIDTTIDRVNRHHDMQGTTQGSPQLCAVWQARDGSEKFGERTHLELAVWPVPDQAYVIAGKFRVSVAPMVELGERPVWPELHDRTVHQFAVCAWIGFAGNSGTVDKAAADQKRREALTESIDLDADMHGKNLGRMSDGRTVAVAGTRYGVTNFDGSTIISG
jgi:hypothetical protein